MRLSMRLSISVISLIVCLVTTAAKGWGWRWGALIGIAIASVTFFVLTIASKDTVVDGRKAARWMMASGIALLAVAIMGLFNGRNRFVTVAVFVGAAYQILYSLWWRRHASAPNPHSPMSSDV